MSLNTWLEEKQLKFMHTISLKNNLIHQNKAFRASMSLKTWFGEKLKLYKLVMSLRCS